MKTEKEIKTEMTRLKNASAKVKYDSKEWNAINLQFITLEWVLRND